MDFLRQFLIMVAIIACEGEELKCSENQMRNFYLLEGEAFVFRLRGVTSMTENLHDEAFQWHKNGTQPEQIFTWENQSVHYHNKCLFFLKVGAEHAGVYTARHLKENGGCSNYYARIHVVKSESDPKLLYGKISNSNNHMRVLCPRPIASICDNFRGNFSWKKDFKLSEGHSQNDWWIGNFSKKDEGVYTCVCTWMHNSEVYQSTGSRKISQATQQSRPDFSTSKPQQTEPRGDADSSDHHQSSHLRIFQKHNIPVQFKPSNTLRQKLVHPKDKTPRHQQSNVVDAVQCQQECRELYIGETKQPLHKRMAQHRRATASGQDSAVHLHLKESGHSFEDNQEKTAGKRRPLV